jgi:hypothetical protein
VVEVVPTLAPLSPAKPPPKNHPVPDELSNIREARGGGSVYDVDVPSVTAILPPVMTLGRNTAMIVCGVVVAVGA